MREQFKELHIFIKLKNEIAEAFHLEDDIFITSFDASEVLG